MNKTDSIQDRLVLSRLLEPFKATLFISLIMGAGVLSSRAEPTLVLKASDGSGTSSLTTPLTGAAAGWVVTAGSGTGVAAGPGTNYVTGAFTLRTPNATTSGNNYIFQGDSLTLSSGARLLGKFGNNGAVNNVSDTITITNFILNGGYMDSAGGASGSDNESMTVGGNINVTAASGIGALGESSSQFETLNIAAIISGSGTLTNSGPAVNSGSDSGVVELSAANPYSGTIIVSNATVQSATYGLLELNNLNSLSNATLNVPSAAHANVVSFASGANTGTFNIGGLTGNANLALTDTAGSAVTLSIGGNNSSSTYGGSLTGSGNLVNSGSGTFTLAGANTYNGTTTVSGGTLALGAEGSISNTTSITVSDNATFDTSALSGGYTLLAGQSLYGSGTNKGSITVASGASVYGDPGQPYGTNTFTGNLTFSSGASVNMDLGTSYNGANDLIVVGTNLTLNNTVFKLTAPSTSVNLDTSDYILMTVGGTITGNPALNWNVAPANSAHYSIGKSGNNIILHYNSSLVPSGTGSVSPNPVVRNQPVLITVTVTFSSNPINTVIVDASQLGGSSTLPLIAAGGGVYTNTVVVAPSISAGTATLAATMTDSASLVGTTPPFTVTVNVNSSETWGGGGTDNNWSTNPNWQSGYAPGYVGDSLTFAGTARLNPNMDASYSIADLTFDGTAGSFVLGSSGGYGLTLTDGNINNNSANTEVLNLSITNSANGITFNGGANIVVSNSISGVGELTDNNGAVVVLDGTNAFTGGMTLNSGTLQIAGSGLLGGTNGNYAGNITNYAVFQYSSSSTQTLSGAISVFGIIKDGSGTLTLAGNNTYFSDTFISNGVLRVTGTLGSGNYLGNIWDYGTLEWSSSAPQTLGSPGIISGTGGLLKDGSDTLTLNGENTYSGATVVNDGTLVYNPNTVTYPTINALSVGSNATVLVNANNGASLPVGTLTLNVKSILNLSYSFNSGNPTVAAVDVLTNLWITGTNVVLQVSGFGAAIGSFPLISYTGTPLANLNNFVLRAPPGLTAYLSNDTANVAIDLVVTASSPSTWIPLVANDAAGNSSFTNIDGNFQGGSPPTPGNGYYTQGYVLRTPADSNDYTFGGSALSIDAYTIGSGNAGGRLLMKGAGGAVITITNLIMDGGLADYANVNSDNGIETLAGNILLNAGFTSYLGALGLNPTTTETLLVTAPISGSGNLQIGGTGINSGTDIGPVVLLGNNTYSGNTTVATGSLFANGSAPDTSVSVLTNATIGGTGSIGGTVTVQAGGILAPGIPTQGALTNLIGTLTVGGVVSVSGTVEMKINRASSPNSDELVAPHVTINPGSTLTVNNIGSTNFAAGDTFKLIGGPVTGSFAVTNLPVLPSGLAWTNELAVNGSIAVFAASVAPSGPQVLTNSYNAVTGILSLSWPGGEGWRLQVQTNSVSTGLGTNWVYVTDGTASSTNIMVVPANGAVFYRLAYP